MNPNTGTVTVVTAVTQQGGAGFTGLAVVKKGSGTAGGSESSFDVASGLLILPVVQVGGLRFSAELQSTGGLSFALVNAAQIQAEIGMDTPFFDLATSILHIPVVRVGVQRFGATLKLQGNGTFALVEVTSVP